MDSSQFIPFLLVAQGLLGGFDTLYNHELREDLPNRSSAKREIGIHAIRELNYGLLFLGLAWFAWQGATVLWVLALLALEILVTGLDEWIENKTRVLPGNERVLHMVLTLNFGLIAALVVLEAMTWISLPSAVVPAPVSFLRWPITLLGVASLAWGLRDAIAYRGLPGATSPRPTGDSTAARRPMPGCRP